MARVWIFGDNVSTDDIIAGRYLVRREPSELAKHVMENLDPEFASKVRRGDVIVAGKNFGCGSSREQAPIALKAAGISTIVAESFARIFFRNAINQGLPVLVCKGAREGFEPFDEIEVKLEEGKVCNLTTGKIFKAETLPDFILEIIRAGGLLDRMEKKARSQD